MLTFILKTAWRDARRQQRRLLLCALSIVFGVAALVAVDSFSANLNRAMDAEAKALLGADLQITSRVGFDEKAELIFSQIGGEQARETRFASMAYFPSSEGSRLVQLRALGGGFPFYGEFETDPIGANPAQMDRAVAVVDPLLMVQYELEVGDRIELGDTSFEIIASIVRVPGEAAFAGLFAPRVYIPHSQLESTGLIGKGSIAFHRFYAANFLGTDEELLERFAEPFASSRLRAETVQDQREDVGRPLDNLTRFLGLVGFVALLLGGVGIAGAIQAYLETKRDTVAVLRCLGSDARTAMSIFWVQVLGVAIFGGVVGAALGVFCQAALPRLLAPLLPFELEFFVHWQSVFVGAGYGILTALLFGLFPLLPLRRVSPLQAIRAQFESGKRPKDFLVWIVSLIAIGGVSGFCMIRTERWWQGLIFAAALLLVVGLLWSIAVLLKWVLKRSFRRGAFVWRQALANLHRPNNRTVFLSVSLGVGTFLIFTLVLVQAGLLQQTDIAAQSTDPNILFFDVQPDQYAGLEATLASKELTIIESAPVVTMRLSQVNGIRVSDIKKDPDNKIGEWILNREWRSTYRGKVGAGEKVIAGEYIGEWRSFEEPVPISLEADMAGDLGIEIGDTLTYDIQGIPMQVRISSLRKVDWTEMRPNFFATFPLGVLEDAPQWWIAVARSPDLSTTAAIQSELFAKYPNISAVDLNVILDAVQNVFSRINFAIRFMGLFTAATGIIILANAISTSRNQRIRESVLLRTLGASGAQIRTILGIEYALIGLLSAITGTALALLVASALGIWVFKVEFYVPWLQVFGAVSVVTGLSVITGMSSSRGIASHPPLVILREDG
ncbi:MAG: ABC transporter permease [Opitutaceae bacterium]